MKSIVLLVCLSFVAVSFGALEAEWLAFKQTHNKNYPNHEESMRRAIFEETKKRVDQFNLHESEQAGYKLGLNHMSDWTVEERAKLNGYRPSLKRHLRFGQSTRAKKFVESLLRDTKPIPDEFDWRKVPGRVTRVKNQGQCGSCWAFSVTGLLEGQEYHLKNNLTELSEQNLVDCSKNGNEGCDGGWPMVALEFIRDKGGIDDEKSYPYTAKDGKCKFNKKNSVLKVVGPALVTPGNKEDLKAIVGKYGPVSVLIEVTNHIWDYKSGVYVDKTCSHWLNHAVLVVGYGNSTDGTGYWIVKNSWGSSWGEEGYIKMSMENIQCGIYDQPVIALL